MAVLSPRISIITLSVKGLNSPIKRHRVGPAPWLSGWVCVLHCGGPGFHRFESWAWMWHCSSGHAGVASCMPQLEGPTTKGMQLCTWGFWGEKGKEKRIFKKKKPKNSCLEGVPSYSQEDQLFWSM